VLKARSAGGRQTRSRTAKATPNKRASVSSKKDAEEKKSEAGTERWLLCSAHVTYIVCQGHTDDA
jgi:hypothetical protein